MSWIEFERVRASNSKLDKAFLAVQTAIEQGGPGAALSADTVASVHGQAEEQIKSVLILLMSAGLLKREEVAVCRCGEVLFGKPEVCPLCDSTFQDEPPRIIVRYVVSFLAREKNAALARITEKRASLSRIGVITALPLEGAAVTAMLDDLIPDVRIDNGRPRTYDIASCKALNGQHNIVHLCLGDMGNNIAASRAAIMKAAYPAIQHIIMVGIAGGVPNVSNPREHVRLGDIVVSDRGGVVQYDFGKREGELFIPRNRPVPPAAQLLEAITRVDVAVERGDRRWIQYLTKKPPGTEYDRPDISTDVLHATEDQSQVVKHPHDPNRIGLEPRVFLGPVASSNTLLKDPVKRDQLRKEYHVKAVEMEGSGIADATWDNGIGYLVIRGICDYCDTHKTNTWQRYAAVAAAAYLRCLLAEVPVLI